MGVPFPKSPGWGLLFQEGSYSGRLPARSNGAVSDKREDYFLLLCHPVRVGIRRAYRSRGTSEQAPLGKLPSSIVIPQMMTLRGMVTGPFFPAVGSVTYGPQGRREGCSWHPSPLPSLHCFLEAAIIPPSAFSLSAAFFSHYRLTEGGGRPPGLLASQHPEY